MKPLQAYLDRVMADERISAYAVLPYTACREVRPYLRERLSPFVPQSAVIFLVPYYAGETENLSRYAAAEDYHLYMRELFARLTVAPSGSGYRFYGFSDHSPIDERHAACAAGLGMRGDNGLLIHPDLGSFVFIGELLTDAPPDLLGAKEPVPPAPCLHCGACRAACPSGILRGEGTLCLSAVTQQKGELNEEEKQLLLAGGTVWGCDICQTVCPYNQRIIARGYRTPIPFFRENRITRLRAETLAAMDDETFRRRAFSFRGRQPLARNLELLP